MEAAGFAITIARTLPQARFPATLNPFPFPFFEIAGEEFSASLIISNGQRG